MSASKTTTLRFTVLHGSWTAEGERFDGGEHEIADPSEDLVRLAGSAHAAGAIRVDEGLETSHVESEEESLARLEELMGEWQDAERDPETGAVLEHGRWTGPWAEGHELNAAIGASAAETAADIEAGESE